MRRARLLLVEDDPHQLKAHKAALENEGFEVRTAVSASAAEGILTSRDPLDLVIFDLHLNPEPGVRDRTGLRLARQFPNLLRIIWTAEHEDGPNAVGAVKEGIDFVFKQRGIRELIDAVRSALGRRVFLIHGHDRSKDLVFWFLQSHGLKPIILGEQPDGSLTIIELLERYSGVECAVALLMPDDEGRKRNSGADLQPRARQNVVFELGYFSAALGREKVFVLSDETVERPSDYAGVRYIPFNGTNQWQDRLLEALKHAGLRVEAVRAPV
jgi:predicted nucleotide-binding protein